MEAIRFSEMLVTTYKTAWNHIPEDRNRHRLQYFMGVDTLLAASVSLNYWLTAPGWLEYDAFYLIGSTVFQCMVYH
jgi:hypothetical protein